MEQDKKCCGNCRYARVDELGDLVCVNDCSYNCADYIERLHVCLDWEGRKECSDGF